MARSTGWRSLQAVQGLWQSRDRLVSAPARWVFRAAPANCTSPSRVTAGFCSTMELGGEEESLRGCNPRAEQQIGSALLGLTGSLSLVYMGRARNRSVLEIAKKECFRRTPTLLHVICSTLQSVCCFFWWLKLFRELDLNF